MENEKYRNIHLENEEDSIIVRMLEDDVDFGRVQCDRSAVGASESSATKLAVTSPPN